tara:strand:+ start:157 stop:972 length:816 start_codon:yes stop_codon:yes gene_type:complete
MKKNLVLTAAFGFTVSQLEFFIKTLRKYYTGDVCFIIGFEDYVIEQELKKYNCICVKKKIDKRDIQSDRYKVFLEFLENKNYNNILCCDSRDIYFQSNPFDFNYKNAINFFLEDKKIKDCSYNSNWIINTYGKPAFDEVSDKIILCSGTVLGSLEKIREYLTLMKDKLLKHKYKRSLKYFLTLRRDPEGKGCDQGHANYLINKNSIKECGFYTNAEGPIATVYYLKKLVFDKQLRLLNNSQEPYAVVHQYDKRWNEFSSAVNKLKKDLNIY